MSVPETVDLTDSIAPRSDQQNFDDYLSGPRTVTIERVTKGSLEQPIDIHLVEYPGRPYKPSKSMRRVLVSAWGIDASVYVGRRMRLYGDPDVKFGGQTVGGIKISHLSHIEKASTISLTSTRGKRSPHRIEPLPDAPDAVATPAGKQPTPAAVTEAFKALGVTLDQLETRLGSKQDAWTATDVGTLAALGKAIKSGETTTYEEFDPQPGEAEQGELTEPAK